MSFTVGDSTLSYRPALLRSYSALHVRDPGPLKRYTEGRIKIDYYVHVYVHKQLSLTSYVPK